MSQKPRVYTSSVNSGWSVLVRLDRSWYIAQACCKATYPGALKRILYSEARINPAQTQGLYSIASSIVKSFLEGLPAGVMPDVRPTDASKTGKLRTYGLCAAYLYERPTQFPLRILALLASVEHVPGRVLWNGPRMG